MLIPENRHTVIPMTRVRMPIEVMIEQPGGGNFADFTVHLVYSARRPYEVQIHFGEVVWKFDADMIELASRGLPTGEGDVRWVPARTVQSCMTLRLYGGDGMVCNVAFSIGDLARAWNAIDSLRSAVPDLLRVGESGLPVRVERELDKAISRILEG